MKTSLKKILIGTLPLAGLLFLSTPVFAHGEGRHERFHDKLEGLHERGHENLRDLHREFHNYPSSRREHRRFHRGLEREHRGQHRDLYDWHRDYHNRDWGWGWGRGYYGNDYRGRYGNSRYYDSWWR